MPTTFAASLSRDPQFPDTARSRDDVPGFRVLGDMNNERLALVGIHQGFRFLNKQLRFDNRDHVITLWYPLGTV